jgi:AcrR family transcriptional regulator
MGMPKRRPTGNVRRTQQERTEATTAALIAAARQLFARVGFADTAIEDVLQSAGVTRGALYHHFDSKHALFRAVFELEEKALCDRVMAAAGREPLAGASLRAGCRAFLEVCLDPDVQRIVLSDAPAVLPPAELREIEARYAFAMLYRGLERAVAEGAMAPRPVEMLARFLFGALSECATAIARSTHPKKAFQDACRELDFVLGALQAAGAADPRAAKS